MFDFLLKKNILKLDLLLKLSNQKTISIAELSSEFNLPKRTIHRSLTILDNDLSIVSNNTCSIQYHPKKILLLANNSNFSLNLFHELKLFYLKQSPHFLLLKELITDGFCNIDELSIELHISNSHIYHLINELNLKLEKYELKISNSQEKKLELLGSEFTIRAFSFRVINESYQLIEWPFKSVSKNDIFSKVNQTTVKRINDPSENEKNQMFVYLAILDSRLSKKKYFSGDSLLPETKNLLNVFQEDAYLSEHIEDFLTAHKLQPIIFKMESLIFNMFFRLLIPSIFTEDQENRIGKRLLNVDSSFFKFIKPLCKEFIITFNINGMHTLYHLYYSLTKYSLLVELLGINLNTLLSVSYAPKNIFIEKGKPDYLDVHNFLETFIKNNKPYWEHMDLESRNKICNILYMYLDTNHQTNLKIYLHFSKNNFGEKLLAKKIQAHFNPSNITITSIFTEADIIISDSMENEHYDKDYLYMYDINNQKLFFEVILFISQRLILDSQEV